MANLSLIYKWLFGLTRNFKFFIRITCTYYKKDIQQWFGYTRKIKILWLTKLHNFKLSLVIYFLKLEYLLNHIKVVFVISATYYLWKTELFSCDLFSCKKLITRTRIELMQYLLNVEKIIIIITAQQKKTTLLSIGLFLATQIW